MYIFLYVYIIYRVSYNIRANVHKLIEQTKLNGKILYHFAMFATVNELLVIKNHRIYSVYCRMQASGDIRPPNSGCLYFTEYVLRFRAIQSNKIQATTDC